jgi:hypothetical protein
VNFALEEIAARLNAGTLKGVVAVPTGTLSAKEAAVAGIPVVWAGAYASQLIMSYPS